MPFDEDDKAAIKLLRLEKGYTARQLLKEFPNKPWTKGGLDKLLRKIDETGTTERQEGSGRPRTARTPEMVEAVLDLAIRYQYSK
jgi:hypothetical protein